MKFVCLGFSQEKAWNSMTKKDQDSFIEECFAYDNQLLKSGHWLDGGQALQDTQSAKTLRWKNGKVVVTDGPFAETKEQLGGFGILEATDIDHAVELVSKHPCIRNNPVEIRPINEERLKKQAEFDASLRATSGEPIAKTGTQEFCCFGYIDETEWAGIPKGEFEEMMAQCTSFDETRRRDGQLLSGMALLSAATAKTLRSTGGKVIVTDGPFAETKEQLGGVIVLSMKDMSHAIELMATHAALRFGVTMELRPIDEEMNARWEARRA